MFAEWLNSFFSSFDYAGLEFFHSLALQADGIFNPIARFLDIFTNMGYVGFIIAFPLLLFPKTRKCGVCVLISIAVSGLLNNLIIKNLVARPRPYVSEIAEFREWWQYVGAHKVGEFSFPSGHTAVNATILFALFLAASKKYKKWLAAPCFFFVAAVGASRNYLMVHYPTDVIAGFITGAIGATVALLVTNLIWKKLIDNQNKKFCAAFIDADIRSLFSKRICAKKEALNTEKNEEPDID